MTIYLEAEVAARLHRSKRWLMEWLRENPTDRNGITHEYRLWNRAKAFVNAAWDVQD